ncbi:TonB-dependent siderophore receptor [Colwellia sp. 75C3]|uniref:TonB-dependent siderophore receptor n=1 Tax=Colwellia sp. 75C3 TaxID=888425 RepID=UPI0012FEEEDB|nr:TonB-dependent siderophore receptor [Colwellia sp. 75C3]
MTKNKILNITKVSLSTVLISSLVNPVSAQGVNSDNAYDSDTIEHIEVSGRPMSDIDKPATTATKMDVSIKDTGRSMMELDADALKMRAIQDVREAFNYVAGFRANGPADRTYIARGFSTSIDNVMVDGLRSLQGGEGGTGSKLPSTFNAENTTFLRGPEAILYGAGVAGGLINITSKKPQTTAKTTIGLNNRSYVSSDTGNFKRNNTSFNLDSTGPITDESILYRVLAQYTPSGDHFQDGREIEELLFDAALSFDIGENTTILPRFEKSDRKRTGGSGYADGVFESNFETGEVTTYGKPINRGKYYGSPIDIGENESTSASLLIKHQLTDDWKLAANVRHNETTSNALDLYISDSSALENEIGKDVVNRKWVYSAGDDSYNLFDITAEGRVTTGSIEHHLLAGYNYREMDINFARAFQSSEDAVGKNPISASNPDNQVTGPIPDGLVDSPYKPRTQTDTNIYLKDRISLGNTTVAVGLAYVKQDQEDLSNGETIATSFDESLWDLGLVQKINDDINVFATYSRAYEPIKGRYIVEYGHGKTDYKPIEGNNYELGIKGDLLNNNLTAALTLFALDRTNSTKWERGEDGWILTQLSGKSFESKGVEIDAAMYFTPKFNSSVSYAFTEAHDTIGEDKGIQANNTPKHALSLWNNYIFDENISFSLGLRYESVRNDNDYEMEAYIEADMGAYYKTDNWDAGLVINNVFDKNRVEAGANWVTVQPNTPRTVNVSLNYHF